MRSLLACLFASTAAAAIAAPQPDPRPAAPSIAPGSVVVIVRQVQECRASSVGLTVAPVDFSVCTRMPTERMNPQGTALWMLADVTLPASMAEQREPMAVPVQSMASSAIYWDGVPIGTSGIVSSDPRREVPGQFVHVVPLRTEEARAGVPRLAIALSSRNRPSRMPSSSDARRRSCALPAILLAARGRRSLDVSDEQPVSGSRCDLQYRVVVT